MKTHSPGPWSFDYHFTESYLIIDKNDQTVCTFKDIPKPLDLRLIQCAPQMYDLLVEMADMFCNKKKWQGTEIRQKIDFVLSWAGEIDNEDN